MKKNACFNRPPYASTMRIQAGYVESGPTRFPLMKDIPFRMSPGCQYQMDPQGYGQRDPGCEGCRWKTTQPRS